MKNDFLDNPDAKLILYCLELKKGLALEECVLITEETSIENDGKLFQKLPVQCQYLEIPCKPLPYLI